MAYDQVVCHSTLTLGWWSINPVISQPHFVHLLYHEYNMFNEDWMTGGTHIDHEYQVGNCWELSALAGLNALDQQQVSALVGCCSQATGCRDRLPHPLLHYLCSPHLQTCSSTVIYQLRLDYSSCVFARGLRCSISFGMARHTGKYQLQYKICSLQKFMYGTHKIQMLSH